MSIDVRVLETEDELHAAMRVFRTAMVGLPPMPEPSADQSAPLFEPGRTIGAFVDGQLVGTADATSCGLTLPGGAIVDHAAVTHIGVLPNFTRRGIASALVGHQLRAIRTCGEVIATLRASEATIYERYGYGMASSAQSVEVRTARAALRRGIAGDGPVRLLDPAQTWDLLPQIYSAHRPSRAGTVARSTVWWNSRRLRAGFSPGPHYVAVHGRPGSEDGFARYHPIDTDEWFVSDHRTIVVEDFFAPSAEAYLGLMRFLLGLDLVDRVVFWSLPLDDPLPDLLTDRRAVTVTKKYDETWLRITDAHRALAARRYRPGAEVNIAVHDALVPENSATFHIDGAGAETTTAPADLHVGITALGSMMLGGTSWRTCAMAGLVRADTDGAVARADLLFATDQEPHAGMFF